MDNKYITGEAFSSHAKCYYLPNDEFIRLPNGMLIDSQNNFVCMAHSQKARDLNLAGNDDSKGMERYHIMKDIKNFFIRQGEYPDDRSEDFSNRIEPGIVRLWDNKIAMKYNQNADGSGPWLWNDDFYCAPLSDLKHIYNLLYKF